MFLKIIHSYSDRNIAEFQQVLSSIKHAFYPSIPDCDIADLKESFDEVGEECTGDSEPHSEDFIKRLEKAVSNYLEQKSKYCYTVYARGEGASLEDNSHQYHLPFSREYYMYFVKRKNSMQYTPMPRLFEEAIKLNPDTNGNAAFALGDYNHFNNVMLATARFVDYFSKFEHVNALFFPGSIDSKIIEQLSYPSEHNLHAGRDSKRPFLLMLAAYYHDLGKTVVYPRHAIEGSVILDNHTTDTLYALNKIAKNYPFESFSREDLYFVSHLVYYHDQFGTLGTGEAGYLRLSDLIYRMKTCCVDEIKDTDAQDELMCSARNLFDLWVLNLADMMVSVSIPCNGAIQDKNESQDQCMENYDKSYERITDFLSGMEERKHDLCIAIDMLQKFAQKRHTDDLNVLQANCVECARRHAVERIRRLLRALLIDSRPKYALDHGEDSSIVALLDKVAELELRDFHAIVSRTIKSISEPSEFVRRFAWVGQMDYSFSFFNEICNRALETVKDKVTNPSCEVGSGRGWCYEKKEKNGDKLERPFLLMSNAEIFVENLTAVIVQIIHHLLFREKEFGRLINFEFTDARDRLTDDKMDRIIAIQGPNREKRSVQLSLEGIFFFS